MWANVGIQSNLHSLCRPQIAVKLLVHKIHSPQEWEALQALTVRTLLIDSVSFLFLLLQIQTKSMLTEWEPSRLQVLEACMKNCGRRFHNEIGKYRFLNELIKVVSPKVSWPVILLCVYVVRETICSVSTTGEWVTNEATSHFPSLAVHGGQCAREGEDEDHWDVIQLDGGLP